MTLEEFIDQNPSFKYKTNILKKAGFKGNIDPFKVVIYLIQHGNAKTLKALVDIGYDIDGSKLRDFR